MKKMKTALIGFVTLFAFGSAQAIPITDTYTLSQSDSSHVTTSHPVSFTHDITDGPSGFKVGVDTINAATLTIRVADPGKGQEDFSFLIGGGSTTQSYTNGSNNAVPNGGSLDVGIALTTSLADLIADGTISLTLSTTTGEYYFVSSTLTAEVTPGRNIPEPFSVTLVGLGLVLIGATHNRGK